MLKNTLFITLSKHTFMLSDNKFVYSKYKSCFVTEQNDISTETEIYLSTFHRVNKELTKLDVYVM